MLPFMPIPVWFIVVSLVVWSLLALGLATALAVLVRQLTYRRPAHPAEWLAVLIALLLVLRVVPNLDTVVNRSFGQSWTSDSFGLCRWIVGGAAMAAFLLGLAVLSLVRRSDALLAEDPAVGGLRLDSDLGTLPGILNGRPLVTPIGDGVATEVVVLDL